VLTVANKRLLISDQQGKPNQYTTRIPCSVRVWSQSIRISHGQRIATFHVVINRFEQIHRSWEEGLPTQPTVHRLTDPWVRTQLLSQNSQRSSGKKSSFCWQPATRLTEPISSAWYRYVQYLLAGANPSVLNRQRRGLQPPKGPTRSQVIQSQHSLKSKWCEAPIANLWSFDHSTSIEVYIYA
jgi:hypothetical protein